MSTSEPAPEPKPTDPPSADATTPASDASAFPPMEEAAPAPDTPAAATPSAGAVPPEPEVPQPTEPQPEPAAGQTNEELERELEQLSADQADSLMAASAEPSPAAKAVPEQAGEDGEGGGEQASGPGELHMEMRRGRITAIRGEDVFVQLMAEQKYQGIVPLAQFERAPRIGSVMDFVVDHVKEDEGLIYLSREGAISRVAWEQLVPGTAVEARVVGTNKGGLELEMVGGIRAFMPLSQMDIAHVDDPQTFVGQKVSAVVREIDRKSKKVMLSRREYLERERARMKAELLQELRPGQLIQGKVANLVDFGAFIDLGGVDGLLHVTDMAWTHVDKPSDMLKKGQDVEVQVLKIDAKKERISLGLKQLQPDPWDLVQGTINPGDEVAGKVVRTAAFGAFVQVAEGVDALLPISELSWSRVANVESVVKTGDTIKVQVLDVDPKKKRMSVSLKAQQDDPWSAPATGSGDDGGEGDSPGGGVKWEVNSWVDGKVTSTTDFGAFVELEEGVEGLVHISELSEARVNKVEDVLQVGVERKFRIKDVDTQKRKIGLSLRKPRPERTDRVEQRDNRGRIANKRKPPKTLKSGLGEVGGLGLGDLKLDDLK